MAIRKEQVLALLTLVVAALVAKGALSEFTLGKSFTAKTKEYVPTAIKATALVTAAPPAAGRANFCTEPGETRPLPPRELALPTRAPLSVAALPLEAGPDFGHLWLVQMDGSTVEGVTLGAAGEAAAPAPAAGPATEEPQQPATSRAERAKLAALTYARVYSQGLATPFFGTLETTDVDLWKLEESKDFAGVTLRLRYYDITKKKVGSVMEFGPDKKVDRIELAATLRNAVRRETRKVAETDLGARRKLVKWLLDQARQESWIYDEALQQAQVYRNASADLEGLRLMQTVLRARGDLAAELAMLEKLSPTGLEGAFRFEGLGIVKARLGLWADAEADLRQAVQLQPSDARPHAALAEFLLKNGRSVAAAASARAAELAINSVQDATERSRVARTIVSCHLAMGQLDAAKAALALVPAEAPQPWLEGCVHYASGQVTAALGAFKQAAGSADNSSALLGQAACLLRDGKWHEAHDLFTQVADADPLLRHRAAAGLALLFTRIGQFDAAQSWLDRALEADPSDPYAHYLRGHMLRVRGQAGAEDELAAALRLRDDFVHAIAEMAMVQDQRAKATRGADQANAAIAARRYMDRAVQLVPAPSAELYELQGLLAFAAAEPKLATEAFQRAREVATDEARKAYSKAVLAVIDYSRGAVDEADTSLQRMVQDLPKDAPLSAWASATLAAIYDHAQKEMLGDGFDREGMGQIWKSDSDGQLDAAVKDGRVLVDGKWPRNGKGEIAVERVGAVQKGRAFLAVGVTMQVGSKTATGDSFAGLGISIQRGNGDADLDVRVGVYEGKPQLRIVDGRDDGKPTNERHAITVPDFDLAKPQALELRVVPRGDLESKQFTLLVSWNGTIVHRHDLRTLTGNTQNELKTLLLVGGRAGADVSVAFDEYVLERRKER